MVIYAEYLFIENFITGCLLLALTGQLAGRPASSLRLLAAGALCGAASFTIFLPASGLTAAATGAAAVAAAFGLRDFVKTALLFISLTFLSGGAAMAFMLWRQIPAVSGNGALYLEPFTYVQLFLWASAAFGLTHFFVKLVRERRLACITKGKVCLTIYGQSYWFEAFADSGNSLREPLTGRPVMVMDIKGASRLPEITPDRYVAVPYMAVGTEKGILSGFRTDSIEFRGSRIKGAVIAFYEGDFGEYEVLLNREVLNDDITETCRAEAARRR